LNFGFLRLGQWVATHPRTILFVWIVAIALGAWGEYRLPDATVGGAAGIPGSPSDLANAALRTEFSNPFIDPLIVAVSAPGLDVAKEPYIGWVRQASQALSKVPGVAKIENYAGTQNPDLRSPDGHITMLIVGITATTESAQQREVAVVRKASAPWRSALMALDPSAQLAVTGGPAADFDVNALSASGGDHAEKSALPLTLIILLMAFGTLIAASLPFLMGLGTTTLALGAAFVLTKFIPVSNLLSNVVTMVGLAIGIDYSLLMVTRYRENQPNESVAERVADTVARAGQTITWSGVTVMIGFLGLLWSPILETRCAGIGGALVVCVSVMAALTLLPATLVLVGPYLERWSVIPSRLRLGNTTAMWLKIGRWIVKHPIKVLVLSGACVLVLGLPLTKATTGVSNERWFLPPAAEARTGADILAKIHDDNSSLTTYAIVRATDGRPVLDAAHIKPLVEYAERLGRDPRISAVASPVTLQRGLGADEYTAFYQNSEEALRAHPEIAELYLSRDRSAALFEITPTSTLRVKQIEQLARDLKSISPAGPFKVELGGDPAEHNDFDQAMYKSLPKIFAFVVGATLIMLFFAFRSYLLPIEAVIMNLLAVTAGIGAVVAVFQHGWFNGLVGLERPFSAIPLEVPMMVFCLSFGLSMDYELFLLFRIKREYAVDQDNQRATIAGLVAVAPVITGAGLIMAAVFGAFIGAQLPVLKMMGVGLCVAVLVDATVIRTFVVPAAMTLGGRFNWYPGHPARRPPALAPVAAAVQPVRK
jgi:putative drug exporter of the RND superfamily